HRQAGLPDRTHAADHRAGRGRDAVAGLGTEAHRDAAPECALHRGARVHILAELTAPPMGAQRLTAGGWGPFTNSTTFRKCSRSQARRSWRFVLVSFWNVPSTVR